jgi:hypothetical protein
LFTTKNYLQGPIAKWPFSTSGRSYIGIIEGSFEHELEGLDPSQYNLSPLAFLCGQ